MDLPRLSPPHMYAGLSQSPASPKEFGGKSPPGAPEVRQERKQGKTPRPAKTGACREGKVPVRAPEMWAYMMLLATGMIILMLGYSRVEVYRSRPMVPDQMKD
ncbi:hypothetical protein NDU88_006343 [Pleurodeles waltl]|uniref:Uncharacterized protein n=2 Tax=Pleurodeles waltl TaxID=8319 RepID=A0AAV7NPZ6_PLEWA|nr:hypothetical protein NDU88_006343 [Pleurodeles waltl]